MMTNYHYYYCCCHRTTNTNTNTTRSKRWCCDDRYSNKKSRIIIRTRYWCCSPLLSLSSSWNKSSSSSSLSLYKLTLLIVTTVAVFVFLVVVNDSSSITTVTATSSSSSSSSRSTSTNSDESTSSMNEFNDISNDIILETKTSQLLPSSFESTIPNNNNNIVQQQQQQQSTQINNSNNGNDEIRIIETQQQQLNNNDTVTTTPTTTTPTIITLDPNRSYGFWDPDVEALRKQYWSRTFREIRALTQQPSSMSSSSLIRRKTSTTTTTNSSSTSTVMMVDNNNSNSNSTQDDDAIISTSSTNTNSNKEVEKMEEKVKEDANLSSSSSYTIPTPFSLLPSFSSILSSSSSSSSSSSTVSQVPRFDGFISWERMMYEWNETIQEYIQQIDIENQIGTGYSMSNYGRSTPSSIVPPSVSSNSSVTATSTLAATPSSSSSSSSSSTVSQSSSTSSSSSIPPPSKILTPPIVMKTVSKVPLPIPVPAKPGDVLLDHTDISNKSKSILIVTTASLPWKTGTAVNPLLRAAYLSNGRKQYGGNVTLMVPWLERKVDQMTIYGSKNIFTTPYEQEQYIRTWLRDSANMVQASEELHIAWYTAWQNKVENSIYSMGDITANISSSQYDICILEEPEHLNWYRAPGESWTKKFPHVVGILHTNYFSYALDQPAALIRAPAMRLLCSWMCRAHCHRVIKLSGTLDPVAPEKELVENVHGVRGTFLDIGANVRKMIQLDRPSFFDITTTVMAAATAATTSSSTLSISNSVFRADADPTIYFIGKMLWSKGLGSLMELLKFAEESASLRVAVDMYGGGPDQEAAMKKSEKLALDMTFHGPLDHAELAYTHKIFVNPSTSEVLCTTSAEALAMGKFVIIPSHPSNDFFAQFPNCLTYATKEEFVGELYYAMTHTPEPLSDEYAYALSWEAATERLALAGCITKNEHEQMQAALSSDETGIEIALPPIVDNEESRKEISKVFRFSRLRYRQFRTRLSQEIQESKLLPSAVRDRLVAELDKRLELDIDQILESPKLRLKLSPAELDKSLLELYDTVSESPGGDILRLIGGGGAIALQNLYIRRRSERERWRKIKEGATTFTAMDIFPSYVEDDGSFDSEINDGTPTQLIRQSLRRNLPRITPKVKTKTKTTSGTASDTTTTPTMSLNDSIRSSKISSKSSLKMVMEREWQGLRPVPKAFCRSTKFSILI